MRTAQQAAPARYGHLGDTQSIYKIYNNMITR